MSASNYTKNRSLKAEKTSNHWAFKFLTLDNLATRKCYHQIGVLNFIGRMETTSKGHVLQWKIHFLFQKFIGRSGYYLVKKRINFLIGKAFPGLTRFLETLSASVILSQFPILSLFRRWKSFSWRSLNDLVGRKRFVTSVRMLLLDVFPLFLKKMQRVKGVWTGISASIKPKKWLLLPWWTFM